MGVALETVQHAIRDLLPRGTFWRNQAGERLVRALATAIHPTASRIQDIHQNILPETASRPVLEQWWRYLVDLDCLAIPADTDELRSTLARFFGGLNIATAEGLRTALRAFLPMTDIRESLPVSVIPSAVPFPVEPTGQVLEIWYPPAIYNAVIVECIARRFASAADALRLVTPGATFRYYHATAGASGLAYTYANGGHLVVERAPAPGASATETAHYTPSDPHGFATLATIFPGLADGDSVDGQEIRWTWQHDLGSGVVPTTLEETARIVTQRLVWSDCQYAELPTERG